MITLSNGHKVKWVVASGALAFDGKGWPWERPLVWLGLIKPELFTVVLKSLTRYPVRGNLRWWKPWGCVKLIRGGSVNKVGLTNNGIEWWMEKVAPHMDFLKYDFVASIFGTEWELVDMVQMLNLFPFVAIEINVSCPNKSHDDETGSIIATAKAVAKVSRHPVWIKVAVDQDYMKIANELAGTVSAMAFNSVKWSIVFPGKQSPLHRLEKKVGGGGGGVSGTPAQNHNWPAAQAVAQGTKMPVIFPSVMNKKDVETAWRLGASAVGFGAIHLRTPWRPTSIVQKELLR